MTPADQQTPMFASLETKLRENVDYGDYDGYGPDDLHIGAANAIRDLRVALNSQIDISNTERANKERAERDLAETVEALREIASCRPVTYGNQVDIASTVLAKIGGKP